MDEIHIHFFIDEHTTATNGRYELREALEREFVFGTFNDNYNIYFPPIFSGKTTIDLKYCDSKTTTLVRAADIVANNVYHHALTGFVQQNKNLIVKYFP